MPAPRSGMFGELPGRRAVVYDRSTRRWRADQVPCTEHGAPVGQLCHPEDAKMPFCQQRMRRLRELQDSLEPEIIEPELPSYMASWNQPMIKKPGRQPKLNDGAKRRLLELRRTTNLTVKELAARFSVSEATIAKILAEARKAAFRGPDEDAPSGP